MDINEKYYEQNADKFIVDTINCNMNDLYHLFEKELTNPKTILDLGFGSGRDSKYFHSKGYDVYAIDPSKAFCKHALKIGIPNVYNIEAQAMNFENKFDGIWACASLLHIPSTQLNSVFKKCYQALKPNGIMYVSFKYGSFEGIRNGRFFLDLNEKSLKKYLSDTNFKIILLCVTDDVRDDKTTKWLNAILKKYN